MDEPLSSKAHKLDQPGLSHVFGDLGASAAVTSSGRTAGRGSPGDDAATDTMPALPDRLRDLQTLRPRPCLLPPSLLGRGALGELEARPPPSSPEPGRPARPPRSRARPPQTPARASHSRGGSPFRAGPAVCQSRAVPGCVRVAAAAIRRSRPSGGSTACCVIRIDHQQARPSAPLHALPCRGHPLRSLPGRTRCTRGSVVGGAPHDR